MVRERRIAIGKDYSEKFVVGAHPGSPLLTQANNYGWYNPRNHMHFGTTQTEELAIIADARAAAAGYVAPNAWSRSRPDTIKVAIEKHFGRKGYGTAFSKELAKFVDYSPWQEFDQQQRLISFQMLNEFLGQDSYDVYGDFLEENWDELYDKAVQFIFNEYPHSATLLREFQNNNILTFRPRLPKIAQKEIEALTKEQLNKLRALSVISETISNNNARARLKSALAVLNGEQSVSVPPAQIINTFARAFAKAVGDSNPTSGVDLLFVQKQFIEVLSNGSYYLTAERAESASDKLFTNDVLRYANYLYDNSDKFTLSELFFASICWLETKLIARTGTKADVLGIFLQVMDTYKEQPENILEFFRMVGEAGASYDGEVPTMSHWKKAFSEGYLDTIMGAEITLSLIAGSDKTVTKLERQRMYRKAFKAE